MTAAAKKSEAVDVQVTVKLSVEDLTSAIVSGMIGGAHGYGYWCSGVKTHRLAPSIPDTVVSADMSDEEIALNVIGGGQAKFSITNDDGSRAVAHLTRQRLERGFIRWALEFGRGGTHDEESGVTRFEIDAPASDAIMQFALFGRQVYG